MALAMAAQPDCEQQAPTPDPDPNQARSNVDMSEEVAQIERPVSPSADNDRERTRPKLRFGKWTREEEAYAAKISDFFASGRLPLVAETVDESVSMVEGSTLTSLLASLLNCQPMRISKKQKVQSFGNMSYRHKECDMDMLQEELGPIEAAFHESIGGTDAIWISLLGTNGLATPLPHARRVPKGVCPAGAKVGERPKPASTAAALARKRTVNQIMLANGVKGLGGQYKQRRLQHHHDALVQRYRQSLPYNYAQQQQQQPYYPYMYPSQGLQHGGLHQGGFDSYPPQADAYPLPDAPLGYEPSHYLRPPDEDEGRFDSRLRRHAHEEDEASRSPHSSPPRGLEEHSDMAGPHAQALAQARRQPAPQLVQAGQLGLGGSLGHAGGPAAGQQLYYGAPPGSYGGAYRGEDEAPFYGYQPYSYGGDQQHCYGVPVMYSYPPAAAPAYGPPLGGQAQAPLQPCALAMAAAQQAVAAQQAGRHWAAPAPSPRGYAGVAMLPARAMTPRPREEA
ncbi:hypothetical protein M885DRAFT_613129 [Pelagophyceae sp. CCMP2097]|nr:hypothetical protein M885DRAFT_613129 [Pelagophyceae sp. CCMP2097]|mmetsp:Transcript_25200/g.86369  ORF Transcript_25200/g.86369 Transcript_25200/m.86369 type:complete len:508 (+) Transcript_25200:74-1597(+)